MHGAKPLRRWIGLAATLLLLNISLTFQNVWPTPAIRWRGELSVELAVCVLALAAAHRWLGRVSRALVNTIAAVCGIL